LAWTISNDRRFVVLADACVLYKEVLRDLLIRVAMTDLYRLRWTDKIHDEWINSLLRKRPDLDRARLLRTRDKMNETVPDSLVTGYEALIPCLELPDPDDRHVLAAAIVGRCDMIVTYNERDFPDAVLGRYSIEVQHPDEFLVNQLDLDENEVIAAVRASRARLKNPPRSVSDYLDRLLVLQLPQTASRLKQHHRLL
jgi:PIN domain